MCVCVCVCRPSAGFGGVENSIHPFYMLIETRGSNDDHDKEKLMTFLSSVMEEQDGGGGGGGGEVETGGEGEGNKAPLAADGVLAQDETQAAALWRLREDITLAVSQAGRVYKYDVSTPVMQVRAPPPSLSLSLSLSLSALTRLYLSYHLSLSVCLFDYIFAHLCFLSFSHACVRASTLPLPLPSPVALSLSLASFQTYELVERARERFAEKRSSGEVEVDVRVSVSSISPPPSSLSPFLLIHLHLR